MKIRVSQRLVNVLSNLAGLLFIIGIFTIVGLIFGLLAFVFLAFVFKLTVTLAIYGGVITGIIVPTLIFLFISGIISFEVVKEEDEIDQYHQYKDNEDLR